MISASASAPPATATISQAEQPRDFGALIDRLVQAREASGSTTSASVRMSLPHADFGALTMRLDHAGGNLTVGVTSADPAFAPAARAALADGALANTGNQANGNGQPGTTANGQDQHSRGAGGGQQAPDQRSDGRTERPSDLTEPRAPHADRDTDRSTPRDTARGLYI